MWRVRQKNVRDFSFLKLFSANYDLFRVKGGLSFKKFKFIFHTLLVTFSFFLKFVLQIV